jgi:hypothetical protein
MPQERLCISPDEILHFEIYCDTCKTSTILPLKGQTVGTHPALYQCLFCDKPFSDMPMFQNAVQNIRNGLALLRDAQGNFTVRLVTKK